jgi:IS5 family transposase
MRQGSRLDDHGAVRNVAGRVVLQSIFDRLLQKARERKITRGRKMRIDTTVVEAPIHYPTDSDLCADGVRILQRELARLVAAGVQLPFRLRNVSRSVQRRLAEIGRGLRLRGDKAKDAIKTPYRRLLRVTARLVRQAETALALGAAQLDALDTKAQRTARRGLERLQTFAPRVRQVVTQTRARIVRGVTNSKDKLISIIEPTARILRRGKLHKPTEFGRLVIVQEADGGIVTDVCTTNAGHDSQLLVRAVERHIDVFDRAPPMVATDRGFYSTQGVARIQELGVQRPVIPKPGGKSKARRAYEQQRWFRRGRAWRAGGEAKIARLKHVFGIARSRYRGSEGMARAVKWAGIANNLVAIARA